MKAYTSHTCYSYTLGRWNKDNTKAWKVVSFLDFHTDLTSDPSFQTKWDAVRYTAVFDLGPLLRTFNPPTTTTPNYPTPGMDFDELQHKGKEVAKLKEQLRCSWLTLRAGRLCWTGKPGVPHVKGSWILNPLTERANRFGKWFRLLGPAPLVLRDGGYQHNVPLSGGRHWRRKKRTLKWQEKYIYIYLSRTTASRKKALQLISQPSEALPRHYRFRK